MAKRAASTRDGNPKKRIKRAHGIGAPRAEDNSPLLSQVSAPSSTGLSVRPSTVPSLVNICANVFAANLYKLFEKHKEEQENWLKLLPGRLVARVLGLLTESYPGLPDTFISTYFLRGDPIILTGAMENVSRSTIHSILTIQNPPKELHLIDLDKITDAVFSSVFRSGKFSQLEVLNLRGSVKVGAETMENIARYCSNLRSINLNFTNAPPATIAEVTSKCTNLEVLKLAGIPNLKDPALSKILHLSLDERPVSISENYQPLPHLRSLKLRHTQISDLSVQRIAQWFSKSLMRLDISFCPVRSPIPLLEDTFGWQLEKLSVTSNPVAPQWVKALSQSGFCSNLKTTLRVLHMGALGASGSANTGNLTLTDDLLSAITDLLEDFNALEDVSLVGNSKLGFRGGEDPPLARFIRIIGRRCKVLNLAGISRLRSSHLIGLTPGDVLEDDPTAYVPPTLRNLSLNNTDVDDQAATYISFCVHLETLEVAGTKFSPDALFEIIDACNILNRIDLTSCRGVKLGDRRRFFEVWKNYRLAADNSDVEL